MEGDGCVSSAEGDTVPDFILVQNADPADPALDTFDSGDGEVTGYFRSRCWFNTRKLRTKPPTFEFRVEEAGEIVGYAALDFKVDCYPHDASEEYARQMVVFVVGIDVRFQGQPNPMAPEETIAVSVFRWVERQARTKADCVAIRLQVRSDNSRALAFYRKVGFVEDPAGPRQSSDERAPHLTMRKHL